MSVNNGQKLKSSKCLPLIILQKMQAASCAAGVDMFCAGCGIYEEYSLRMIALVNVQ